MKSAASRRNIIVAVIVAAAAFGLGPRRAEAQFGLGTGFDGFGFGFGFGFGAFSQVPKPESFLYRRKRWLMRGATPRCPPVTSTPTIKCPTSTTFVQRVCRALPARAEMIRAHYGYGPHRPSPATTRTATNVAPHIPVWPLSSFYDEKNQLVWPGDAPTAGELKEKTGDL